MNNPLAARIRPSELSEVVGQRHILAPGKPLYNMITSGNIPNLIFYVMYCKSSYFHKMLLLIKKQIRRIKRGERIS